MGNDIAKRIDAVMRRMHRDQATLCELLQEAALLARDAGQLDGDVTAEVAEPKR
jgi:hypothetical protein